MRMLRKR